MYLTSKGNTHTGGNKMKTFLIIYITLSALSFIVGVVKAIKSEPKTAKNERARTMIYLGAICFNAGMFVLLTEIVYFSK